MICKIKYCEVLWVYILYFDTRCCKSTVAKVTFKTSTLIVFFFFLNKRHILRYMVCTPNPSPFIYSHQTHFSIIFTYKGGWPLLFNGHLKLPFLIQQNWNLETALISNNMLLCYYLLIVNSHMQSEHLSNTTPRETTTLAK